MYKGINAIFFLEGFLDHVWKGFLSTFCMFYLWLINRKCAKERKHQYLTLYQNWNRTRVYFELAVSASYPKIYLPDTFQISFCYGIFHHGWWTTFLWPKVSRLLTMLSHHRLDFRTGLKYSFWAPEVPVLRVRKSLFHCFSSLQKSHFRCPKQRSETCYEISSVTW